MDKDHRVKRETHQCSHDLEGMVRYIKPAATWEHFAYSQNALAGLRNICCDFNPGRGLICLFAGEGGTGKTMADEVIAHQLRMDLMRIDLSVVVSKYIAETEKNLRHVFDAAEDGGVILFSDEADVLFGKRDEVKDRELISWAIIKCSDQGWITDDALFAQLDKNMGDGQ